MMPSPSTADCLTLREFPKDPERFRRRTVPTTALSTGRARYAAPSEPEPSVKPPLTRRRRQRPVENDEYAAFVRRVLRAYARRIARGDIDAIAELSAIAAELDVVMRQAVSGLRGAGYSWAEIATRLGVTRQAAHQRWGGGCTDPQWSIFRSHPHTAPDQSTSIAATFARTPSHLCLPGLCPRLSVNRLGSSVVLRYTVRAEAILDRCPLATSMVPAQRCVPAGQRN